jgi:phosphodiesterase/alkaline phosphatase D-like protein
VTFEYGETTNYGNTVTASQSPISGEMITDVSANITGLKAGTTYHFRVISANSTGTNYGDDLTFKATNNVPGQATQLPSCQTLSVTQDSTTGVTLNGTVNAYGFYTKVSFEYGTTITYGQEVTATPGAVTTDGDTGVSAAITGLTCGTEYHYRLITENSFGISYGLDWTFLGGLKPPTVTTTPVSGITNTSAITGGNISDDGCAAIDDRGVSYTTNPAVLLPENHLPMRAFAITHDGTGTGSFTSNLTGLQPGTTYYVRAYATNGHRGAGGNIISFTTTR